MAIFLSVVNLLSVLLLVRKGLLGTLTLKNVTALNKASQIRAAFRQNGFFADYCFLVRASVTFVLSFLGGPLCKKEKEFNFPQGSSEGLFRQKNDTCFDLASAVHGVTAQVSFSVDIQLLAFKRTLCKGHMDALDIFEPPTCLQIFRDLTGFLLLNFVGKSAQKSPPGKSLANKSPTHFCRGAGPTSRF